MESRKRLIPFYLCGILITALIIYGCSKRSERVIVAFSSDTMGQIRSCGCISKDLGGLGRRATFVKMVKDTSANFLLLDAGDFFSSKINYGKEKADLTLRAMSIMGYDAVVPGEKDFGFGLDYLRKRAQFNNVPIVLANVYDAGTDSLIFLPRKVVTLPDGIKVAVIGVIGDVLSLPTQVKGEGLKILSPGKVLKEEIPKIRNDVDLVIVLAHMPISKAMQFPKKIPGIDVIICGHDAKPMKKLLKSYGAHILQIAKEGRYMGLANLMLDDKRKIREVAFSNAPLTSYYTDDDAIVKLFKAYDLDITVKEKAHISRKALRDKGKKPFAGARSCEKCHGEIYSSWQNTKHAHAFKALLDKGREYDRDCTQCHTTGFYEIGGFENLQVTPELTDVQCEACHGNGSDHIKDPKKKRVKKDSKAVCATCHNEIQSPDFTFEAYWPKIAH